MREGRSRIYYRRSDDKGVSWQGPASGQPLLPSVNYGDFECFHPQIVCTTATGVVGCSFYVFGKWRGIPPAQQQRRGARGASQGAEAEDPTYRIHVQIAGSWDLGKTFPQVVRVTDMPWDPLVKPPFSHGDPLVHFIGEYFGLDAGDENFAVLWTDTRTGMQELFSDVIATKRIRYRQIPQLVAEILIGVVQDGGGWVIIGGKLHKVPPRGPLVQLLEALSEKDVLETADLEAIQKAVNKISD
jgi:hypothetical protein